MKKYTVFCDDPNDPNSTMWIGAVEASTTGNAIKAGREECAKAWGYEKPDVRVCGVVEGDVRVIDWDDGEGL